MTKLLPSKPLTRETKLMTYDGVLEITLAAGQEGQRQHSTQPETWRQAAGYSPVHRSSLPMKRQQQGAIGSPRAGPRPIPVHTAAAG
jgi:hypothetical protein